MHSRYSNYITVSAGIYFALALLLLTLPLKWLLAAIISASVHEMCHIAMIKFLGLRIFSIRIGIYGAKIQTESMSYTREILCALAGPVGGLFLLPLARWIPRIAVCAAFHSLYNLLPVYPSDGGRALRCGIKLLAPIETAEKICSIIETCFLTFVTLLGFYGSFVLHLGFYPALIAFILVSRKLRLKIPLQTGRSQGTIETL